MFHGISSEVSRKLNEPLIRLVHGNLYVYLVKRFEEVLAIQLLYV